MEKKPLILIIDDVPENIQVLLQILEKEKYRFAIATNGQEGFDAIEAEKPDLILLDIILPNMNGFEICKQLKENRKTKDIPIIFLTVLDETDDIIKGFNLGAVDYITKPFNEYEVIVRVKTQLNLRQAKLELQNMNQTKDRLFSIIAHELRNPFNNIINFLELIISNFDSYEKERIIQILTAVHSDGIRVSELLENLLYWSPSQRAKIEVKKQPFNLHENVMINFQLLSESASNKGIELINEVDKEIIGLADQNMISTVLRNIVSNAIKFTDGGSVRVKSKDGNDEIVVSVEDNGVGIAANKLDGIFDLNKHVSTKGTANEPGTGFGLVLSNDFIKSNGGKIWVESKVGKGTTFYFSLKKHKA